MELTKEQEEQIVEELTPIDQEEYYNDMLNNFYNEIDIAGISYPIATILKGVDLIRYNCGMNDFLNEKEEIFQEVNGDYYLVSAIEELLEEEV